MQILSVRTILGSAHRTVWRTCKLMLGCKELRVLRFPLGWYVAKVTCQHFLMLTWLFISTNSLVKRRTTVLSFTYWYQHVYSWHCSPYVSYFTYWENFFKHRDISSLVIISFILMICTFDQAVILLGEIRCWSLLGLKGLKRQILTHGFQEPEFNTLSHNISHFISSPDWTKQFHKWNTCLFNSSW